MDDQSSARRILDACTPVEANRMGRQVQPYDGEKWRGMVDQVAEEGNWLRFSQVKECRDALLATEGRILVEANPSDKIWGIGSAGDEALGNEEKWGGNLLGKALMRVRERLRKEQSPRIAGMQGNEHNNRNRPALICADLVVTVHQSTVTERSQVHQDKETLETSGELTESGSIRGRLLRQSQRWIVLL